jgi:Immunity protein 53
MNALQRLQDWYSAQCDGDWEHQQGVRIESLDNPGWALDIDLADTALADKPFTEVKRG